MQEELISFETAKLAKKKGFKESCEYAYVNDFEEEWNLEDIEYNDGCVFNNKFHNECSAPTQSLLQRWLREKHNIHLVCWWYDKENKFYTEIGRKDGEAIRVQIGNITKLFDTYEQALESGLLEALKLVKV